MKLLTTLGLIKENCFLVKRRLPMRAADLVVGRAKKPSPSEFVFRFDAWFSHQAANANRWAEKVKRNVQN